jgi:hypothetical protein
MHVLRAAAGHRLRDKKRNEDIREELQMILLSVTEKHREIGEEHFGRVKGKRIPKCALN